MIPLLAIGRSMRRSHARRRVLLALDALGSAHLAQVAEHARQSPQRVRAVLHGKLPGFRPELSLLALELVRLDEPTTEGETYEITSRGRLIVKSLERGGLRLLVEGPLLPMRGAKARPVPHQCPACGHVLTGEGATTATST